MTPPTDVIAAVTHPDPYPFYAELTAQRAVHRSAALGLWVVAGAEAAKSVLQDERCQVRPAAESVPRALNGSPAATVFRHLVRMSDGPRHRSLKPAVTAALDALLGTRLAPQTRASARALVTELTTGRLALRQFAFQMPVHVMSALLELPQEPHVTLARVDALVRGFAPGAQGEQVAEAGRAAEELLELFTRLIAVARPDSLLGRLAESARAAGRGDPNVVAANGIGMLTQSYEATAGLVGNAICALVDRHEVRRRVASDPCRVRDVVREVARHDPPVQNTRRWMAVDGLVAGQEMEEGDGILVALAAANRDPAANPDPHRFDIDRPSPVSFTFGAGRHGCPGEAIAVSIAEAALVELLAAGEGLLGVTRPVAYRPSGNLRIPLL